MTKKGWTETRGRSEKAEQSEENVCAGRWPLSRAHAHTDYMCVCVCVVSAAVLGGAGPLSALLVLNAEQQR